MISFIVAFDENKGIGLNNILPWHINDDLKLFKENTLYKNIVMGKTTYINLPKKLVDRNIFVVTRDASFKSDDVSVIHDFFDFLNRKSDSEEEYIVCGGASIYKQSYPYAKKAYISFVKGTYEVDTYFDCFEESDWQSAKEIDFPLFTYKELLRK